MIFLKYKTQLGITLLLLLSLNSCIINREMMFKIPKDGTFVYDSIPLRPYEDYKISIDDKLSFSINTNGGKNLIESISSTNVEGSAIGSGTGQGGLIFTVERDSTIELPVLGQLKVGGLTLQQCEDTLVKLFENQYQDPYIQLSVTNRRCVVFSSNGNTASIVPLNNRNTTLLEVLAMTGGISARGNARLIRVMRKTKVKREIYLIDISTIDGLKYADMVIQGNDYIYIEPRARIIMGGLAELAPITSLISSGILVYTFLIKK
jgi:polysaccharide export outer membrane protein